MTIAQTQHDLEQLLGDPDIRVIALSGKWGTGKTHLWDQVKKKEGLTNVEVGRALYASLFGVADIHTLKLKLLQSDLPIGAQSESLAGAVKSAWPDVVKKLGEVHAVFKVAELVPMIAIATVLRERFIVIDDVERKHEKLGVDELLGFIDECTQKFKARVLLILNTGELGDASSKLWERFREKVIDAEVVLNTTPEEAFDIAVQKSPTAYADLIREAVAACGLTNIRVIGKVIRMVNKLLTNHSKLSPVSLQRVVPSTVLLAAIHFRGLDTGPTTEYVLGFGKSTLRLKQSSAADASDVAANDPDAIHHPRWALMMAKLGINNSDEYETLVEQYLRSGTLDGAALDSALTQYETEAALAETHELVANFVHMLVWFWYEHDDERLREARKLVSRAQWLDPMATTNLHDHIRKIEGGEEVADSLITAWIDAAGMRRQAHFGEWATSPLLHPRIEHFLRPRLDSQAAEMTLPVAMYRIAVEGLGGTLRGGS